MGKIREKTLKSGQISYTAQIVRRKFGYNEARSFDTRNKAERWLRKREAELDADIEHGRKPVRRALRATSLGGAIDKYIDANRRPIGRTKEQVLRTIKDYDIASIPCERIVASDIVEFAQDLSARDGLSSPATIGNYLGHLASVFRIVRPMFGIQLNEQ